MGTTVTVAASASIDILDQPGFSEKERIAAVTIDGDTTIKLGRIGITTDETIVALAGELRMAFDELHRAALARIRARPDQCQSPICPRRDEHAIGLEGCVSRELAPVR